MKFQTFKVEPETWSFQSYEWTIAHESLMRSRNICQSSNFLRLRGRTRKCSTFEIENSALKAFNTKTSIEKYECPRAARKRNLEQMLSLLLILFSKALSRKYILFQVGNRLFLLHYIKSSLKETFRLKFHTRSRGDFYWRIKDLKFFLCTLPCQTIYFWHLRTKVWIVQTAS